MALGVLNNISDLRAERSEPDPERAKYHTPAAFFWIAHQLRR